MNWKRNSRILTPFTTVAVFMVMLLLSLALPQGGKAVVEVSHKVIASRDLIKADGKDIVLWHDYGSFALYRITENGWLELPEAIRSRMQLFDDSNQLMLGSKGVDGRQQRMLQSNTIAEAAGESLYLIQFVGPIKQEWLKAVQDTGAELVHYVANYGYLVWTDVSSRRQLNDMAAHGNFMQLNMPYAAQFKRGPSLHEMRGDESLRNELVTITVQLYKHRQNGPSKVLIEGLLVEIESPWEPVLEYENIRGTIRRTDIAAVADLPDVVWVEEYFPRELNDEVQGQIMANNLALGATTPMGPGYLTWLVNLGLSTDPESYPIVDITDDGIGNGVAADAAGDVTLREIGSAAKPSRLAYIKNCTSAADGAGPDGHGHLNISIAGGYDVRTGFPYEDSKGYQRGLGINPFGRFAGTRVFDDNGSFDTAGCGSTDSSLIRETYDSGARLLSNSWGCHTCAGVYDAASQAYDAGVRDADPQTPGNQEMTILFSAGNYGPDGNTIGTPGNAKNVITVGSSENVRPTWTDGCGIQPAAADSLQDIASFSSRGPAPGGRTKPDLVAPGTHVQATASTNPAYSGFGVCDLYHPQNQEIFAASSGTSHSVPAVAGLTSLAYSFIEQNYGLSAPSPALLKAFIVAHTMYLNGSGAGGDLPSASQGFGLPDMNAAFNDTPRVLIEQSQARLFDSSGESWSLTVAAADPSKPVRVVMAFTDQPGATGREPQVNDVNLTVRADGKTYLGNHMSGEWSVPGGVADRVNTVEAVYLPMMDDRSLGIEVTAFNIAGDGVPGVGDATDQDFTIVCSNCLQQQDFTLQAVPAGNSICRPGSAEYMLNLESVLDFRKAVALRVEGGPSGVNGQFSVNPVTPPGNSLLTLEAKGTAQGGSYPITVVAEGGQRSHSASLILDVYTEQPAPPALLAPTDGTSELPLEIELTWTAVAQAATYEVQIAADPDFAVLVEEAEGVPQTAHTTTALEPGRIYYWRARAINDCAAGQYSRPYRLSTEQLPGGCPIGATADIIYSTDFEDGAEGWSHEGLQDTWTLSSARANSGNQAYYATDQEMVSDQRLLSPPISLPADASSLTLQFWNYQSIEDREDEDTMTVGCFDGANLEISTDGGQSWEQLGGSPQNSSTLITDPHDGFVAVEHENPLAGRAAWCGDPQDWLNSVVAIDQFAGETAQFRFRLGSDQTIGYEFDHEGWFVDDVLVNACYGSNNEAYLPATFK